ncbi:MAG: hypothetical protein LBN06_00715 [Prevotellaceae bacterium]|nr:hypothetical protein [Prevotellaceae bacterium]
MKRFKIKKVFGREDTPGDLRENLLRTIVKHSFFKKFWKSGKINSTFVLWVTDENQEYQVETAQDDFINALKLHFDNEDYTAVANAPWEVKQENLPEGAKFERIDTGIYLQCVIVGVKPAPGTGTNTGTPPPSAVATQATIRIADGLGSLAESVYHLNATHRKVYHIGRGKQVDTPKGMRTNHIIVRDDDPDESQNKRNSCVSRAHADIVFHDSKGFCLRALPGGCSSEGGSSTKIQHKDEETKYPLNSSRTHKPLKDGDRIELGKTVVLEFKIETD